jgi:hypothetical protein
VVKFQNNPQGPRILANEMLAGRLALALGLPVMEPEVVEVSDWLVERNPEMFLQRGPEWFPCAAGLQFGSRTATHANWCSTVLRRRPSATSPQ